MINLNEYVNREDDSLDKWLYNPLSSYHVVEVITGLIIFFTVLIWCI